MQPTSNKVPAVTAAERQKVRSALSVKYGVKLRPGESMSIDIERSADHCHATLSLETADGSERFELEVASVRAERTDWVATDELDACLDLLDAQLLLYFEEDRSVRFHDDWRVYVFDGHELRLRGQTTRPNLDELAERWLQAGGDPDKDKN